MRKKKKRFLFFEKKKKNPKKNQQKRKKKKPAKGKKRGMGLFTHSDLLQAIKRSMTKFIFRKIRRHLRPFGNFCNNLIIENDNKENKRNLIVTHPVYWNKRAWMSGQEECVLLCKAHFKKMKSKRGLWWPKTTGEGLFLKVIMRDWRCNQKIG